MPKPITRSRTRRSVLPWRDLAAVAGAAAMLGYAAWRLPPASALRKLPQTPIDNSRIHASAAWYRLLLEAERHIPAGATVLVRGAPPPGDQDVFIQRFGVALLPGRRVLPPFVDGQPLPAEVAETADYVVLVGPHAVLDGTEPLATTADGFIGRRRRP